MARRSIRYFTLKHLYKRLGFTNYALGLMKEFRSTSKNKPYMALMLPSHIKGNAFSIEYIYPQPPEYFIAKHQQSIAMRWRHPNDNSSGIKMRPIIPNHQGENDERIVATDS